MKFLAIIPARKNSKGLKNKNKLTFHGKPLFYWPIIESIKSKVFDKIVLTTDDDIIIKKSEYFKDKILRIKRPKKLSTSTSKSSEYINHTLNKLKKRKYQFDYFMILEPTSPLTDYKDIINVYKMLKLNKKMTSVVSVQKNIKAHPNFNLQISKDNRVKTLKKNIEIRRQDISKLYYLDGSLYASKINSFQKFNSFIQLNTGAYFPKPYKFIEIDDKFDFELAQIIRKYYCG